MYHVSYVPRVLSFPKSTGNTNNMFLFNRIVPNLNDEDDDNYDTPALQIPCDSQQIANNVQTITNLPNNTKKQHEDDEWGDGLLINQSSSTDIDTLDQVHTVISSFYPPPFQRRRRKLPEIPNNKKCMSSK